MGRIITSKQYVQSLKLCKSGKHKLRENPFGVTWCTRCGLLSNSLGAAPLEDGDALIIVKENVKTESKD